MQITEENRLEMVEMVKANLNFLRSYPGDDKLGIFAEHMLEIAVDWAAAEKMLRIAGSRMRFFPSPVEMREIYCNKIGPPADGVDLAYEGS
jgi:hypothetical protein